MSELILADGTVVKNYLYVNIKQLPLSIPESPRAIGYLVFSGSITPDDVVKCIPLIKVAETISFRLPYIPNVDRVETATYKYQGDSYAINVHGNVCRIQVNSLDDIPQLPFSTTETHITYTHGEMNVPRIVEVMKRYPKSTLRGPDRHLTFQWDGHRSVVLYTDDRMIRDTEANRAIVQGVDIVGQTTTQQNWVVMASMVAFNRGLALPRWIVDGRPIISPRDMNAEFELKVVQDGSVMDFARAVEALLAMISAREVPRVGTQSSVRMLPKDIYRLLKDALTKGLRPNASE